MQGKQIYLSKLKVGNWVYKTAIGVIFVLINIVATSATAADLSQLKCHKIKLSSNPYDTTTGYVCSPKAETKIVRVKPKKPNFKKIRLAANNKPVKVGKVYPAPKTKKSTPKKKPKAKKINQRPRTVTPMVSFNYDRINQDHKLNALQQPKPEITKPKPIAKPNKLESKPSRSGHPYIGIMFGTSIAKVGEEQWDATRDTIDGRDQYKPTSGYKSGFAYGINGGYEFEPKDNLLLSLGIGVYQTSNLSSNGKVYYEDYPPTDKDHMFNYEYKFKATRFIVETKIAYLLNFKKATIIPFFSIGVGPSLNFVSDYEETSIKHNLESGSGFRSNRRTNFTYQLKTGVAFPFNSNYDRVMLGYGYSDLGKNNFENRDRNSGYQLRTGRIKTHEIYVGYTHLFGI